MVWAALSCVNPQSLQPGLDSALELQVTVRVRAGLAPRIGRSHEDEAYLAPLGAERWGRGPEDLSCLDQTHFMGAVAQVSRRGLEQPGQKARPQVLELAALWILNLPKLRHSSRRQDRGGHVADQRVD